MLLLAKRRISKFQQRRWDRIEAANERNLCWQEMNRQRAEWRELLEVAVQNRWPILRTHWQQAEAILRRSREQYSWATGMLGIIKAKTEIATGLNGRESGWDLDSVPVADFGNVNVVAAATVRAGFSTFPNVNLAQTVTSSTDSLPYQLSTLAALNASRASGTSTNFLAVLCGVYCVHANIAAPPTAYAQAATTMNVKVLSTVSNTATTTTAAPPTLATLSLNAAANLLDSLTITSPAERNVATPTGTNLTTVSGIYNGDCHFAEAVMSAAVNHQGTLFFVELECV